MLSYMLYMHNIFSYNQKLLLIAISLISTVTLQNIPLIYHSPFEFFTRYEVLIQKQVNPNIRILFYREFKTEMIFKPSEIYLIKK